MANEELKECILKQNAFLRGGNVEIKVITIKKMRTRYMAIVECDAITHEKILQEGSLSIGWIPACRVFDYVYIFRCYQCGGFGHVQENVKLKRYVLSVVYRITFKKTVTVLYLNVGIVMTRITNLNSILILVIRYTILTNVRYTKNSLMHKNKK